LVDIVRPLSTDSMVDLAVELQQGHLREVFLDGSIEVRCVALVSLDVPLDQCVVSARKLISILP